MVIDKLYQITTGSSHQNIKKGKPDENLNSLLGRQFEHIVPFGSNEMR